MNLILQAVQVGDDVRRSIRDEIGITNLRLNSVDEDLGERRGPSRRGSAEGWDEDAPRGRFEVFILGRRQKEVNRVYIRFFVRGAVLQ